MTERWYVTIGRDGRRTVHLEVRFGPERKRAVVERPDGPPLYASWLTKEKPAFYSLRHRLSFQDLQVLGADAALRLIVPAMQRRMAMSLKEQETQ